MNCEFCKRFSRTCTGDIDEKRCQEIRLPYTNEDYIKSLHTEQFAEFLFERGNGSEYCYGICAYEDECDEPHAQEFCIEQIVKWLKKEVDDG